MTFPRGQVLAHRGVWDGQCAPNSEGALRKGLDLGLGIETDLRDRDLTVVISHDPPCRNEGLELDQLSALISQSAATGALIALNVKSDGLAPLVIEMVKAHHDQPIFLFDMSVPELVRYVALGLPVAVRSSEYERDAISFAGRLGVPLRAWVDGLAEDWYLMDAEIPRLLESGALTLVSPEIHGRDPREAWDWLYECHMSGYDVSICTDRALEFLAWDESS